MLYFCISSIKTNKNVRKYNFFTDQWQLVKSSRKFSAILEFFLGPTFPCSCTFLCPAAENTELNDIQAEFSTVKDSLPAYLILHNSILKLYVTTYSLQKG